MSRDQHEWTKANDFLILSQYGKQSFVETAREIGVTKNQVRGRYLRLRDWFTTWHRKNPGNTIQSIDSISAFLDNFHVAPQAEEANPISEDENLSVTGDADHRTASVRQIRA